MYLLTRIQASGKSTVAEALAADGHADEGFAVVVQDVVLGPHLDAIVAAIRSGDLAKAKWWDEVGSHVDALIRDRTEAR